VGSSASTISGIEILIAPGNGNTGLETTGTASNVVIQSGEGTSSNQNGVLLDSGASVTDSDVDVGLTHDLSTAVRVSGAGVATVSDSRLQGQSGVVTSDPATAAVRRVEIAYSHVGVEVVGGGQMSFEDSLLDTRGGAGLAQAGGYVHSNTTDASLSFNHVTIAGTATPSSVALHASAANGHRADLSFRNGIVSGYGNVFDREGLPSVSVASIVTDYSDYSGATVSNTGPGSITETNHLTADPGFLSATDFHLRADSPLVDAGDPAGLAVGESTTDASGQPRIVDGGGDCVGRRDVGAFEFQPGPRAPVAVAVATPEQPVTGQAVTFDASGSCDPDGDALTYSWAFDEGPVADGVSRDRAFSRRGLHSATVTVTDSTGRTTTATVTVRVSAPALPPFAGVVIPKQTVRASKKGVAKVKLRCPAATVGACAGRLTLRRASGQQLGAVSFSLARGATRRVSVRLSSSARTLLRMSKRLNVTAVSVAHDANRTTRRTSGTVKLLAPP
jgi:hypothetical protein